MIQIEDLWLGELYLLPRNATQISDDLKHISSILKSGIQKDDNIVYIEYISQWLNRPKKYAYD